MLGVGDSGLDFYMYSHSTPHAGTTAKSTLPDSLEEEMPRRTNICMMCVQNSLQLAHNRTSVSNKEQINHVIDLESFMMMPCRQADILGRQIFWAGTVHIRE